LKLLHAAFVVALVMPATPASAVGCHVDTFSVVFGSDSQTHMTVKSGQLCNVAMTMGLRMRSVNAGGPSDMSVAEQAAHGLASVPNLQNWNYVSRPGYVGKDRFVLQDTGEVMTTRHVYNGTSHITVDVDVVP